MKFRYQILLAFMLIMVAVAIVFYVPKCKAFDGAYLGTSFGGILSPVNHLGDKLTDIVMSQGGMKINDQWNTARKPSLNFTVNCGFGRIYGSQYRGIEASINKSRYRMQISKYTNTSELRAHDELNVNLRDVSFALDYKHGYLISKDTMLFAKAGVSRTRARMSIISDSNVKYTDGRTFSHPSYLKNEKIIHPARIGFGVEHKIKDNVSFTCDYTYARYLKHFKLKGTTTSKSAEGLVTAQHNHKVTIQDTAIMIGLKTYF